MGVIMDKLAEPLGNTPQGRLGRLTGELGRQATLLDAEAKRLGSNGGAGDGECGLGTPGRLKVSRCPVCLSGHGARLLT